MKIDIPGVKTLDLRYVLLDYNGTIAKDGKPLEIDEHLKILAQFYEIYVLTGNTYGDARSQLNPQMTLVETKDAQAKLAFLEKMGKDHCIALGNGVIDRHMLKNAALGIAVMEAEGCAVEAMLSADILVRSIEEGLDLILNPTRIAATLRI